VTKKNAIVVAPLPKLAPLAPIVRHSTAPITRAEKKSAIETRKQYQVIQQQRQLTIAAQSAIAEIAEGGFSTYTRTVERMDEIVGEPGRDQQLQEVIDTFYEQSYKRLSAYMVSVNDQGVMNIGATVARGTYQEDGPTGLFARIGGGNGYL
jgi:hypothetical protein